MLLATQRKKHSTHQVHFTGEFEQPLYMNCLKTYQIFEIQSLQFLAQKLQLCPNTRGDYRMWAIRNLLSLTLQIKPQTESEQSAPFFATGKISL